MGLGQRSAPCFQPPFSFPVWYLKGSEEQVKFPGLDVQRQPTDKECPHLKKKKSGSWGPSLIPNLGMHHTSCRQRNSASLRGTSWADKSLKPRLSDGEFLGGVSPSFMWSQRKLLRHHGKVTETCPHPTSPVQDKKLTESQQLPTPVWQTGFLPSSLVDPSLHRQCLLFQFNCSSSLRTGRSKHQLFLLEERP